MSAPSTVDGPGLFEITQAGADWAVTNIRKLAGRQPRPGEGLINTATVLLGLLDGALFAVSLAAQYQYIFRAKHQSWPAIIEAVALDAGMIVFSLLALGLARAGQSARIERALIVVCALGSAAMNYAAADVTSARSVAAYVMPPVFLAIVTDRVVAVVRRHVLGMMRSGRPGQLSAAPRSRSWPSPERWSLYGLRLVLAPGSTVSGLRRVRSAGHPAARRGPSHAGSRGAAARFVHGRSSPRLRGAVRPGPAVLTARAGGPPSRRDQEGPSPPPLRRPPRARRPVGRGRVAAQLAKYAQLGEGTARAYLYELLADAKETS